MPSLTLSLHGAFHRSELIRNIRIGIKIPDTFGSSGAESTTGAGSTAGSGTWAWSSSAKPSWRGGAGTTSRGLAAAGGVPSSRPGGRALRSASGSSSIGEPTWPSERLSSKPTAALGSVDKARHVLLKKLDVLGDTADTAEERKQRLLSIFKGTVPDEAAEAMEDLITDAVMAATPTTA